jgi:hypothetical protein
MRESVVICKGISLGVERRVNVNQLHPPAKLPFDRVQGEQVVAFDY